MQGYGRPLLDRVATGEVDPSFAMTHRLHRNEAPMGSSTFLHKEHECLEVVLHTA